MTAHVRVGLASSFNDAILLATQSYANRQSAKLCAVQPLLRSADYIYQSSLLCILLNTHLTKIRLKRAFSFGGKVTVGIVAVEINFPLDLSTCS